MKTFYEALEAAGHLSTPELKRLIAEGEHAMSEQQLMVAAARQVLVMRGDALEE